MTPELQEALIECAERVGGLAIVAACFCGLVFGFLAPIFHWAGTP